jgi:NAD(P)-dependent dehydrogenase (short-subunit alcohol dehydrogenase family)
MSTQKVAVITGASQGIGAGLVTAERGVNAGVQRFGRIDSLVNNAGLFVAKPFTGYTEEEFATVMGVNVAGFFRITQRAIPHMLEQGSGHIVKTPMPSAEQHAMLGTLHPVGRMGEVSDVVDAVIYLETAPFVTGEILHVDGGQSAGH